MTILGSGGKISLKLRIARGDNMDAGMKMLGQRGLLEEEILSLLARTGFQLRQRFVTEVFFGSDGFGCPNTVQDEVELSWRMRGGDIVRKVVDVTFYPDLLYEWRCDEDFFLAQIISTIRSMISEIEGKIDDEENAAVSLERDVIILEHLIEILEGGDDL